MFDVIILVLIFISALFAFFRGFSLELLSISVWIISFFVNSITHDILLLYYEGYIPFIFASLISICINFLGAKFVSQISKNVDVLIYGENPGSKLSKAKELKIEIMEEKRLNDILDKL